MASIADGQARASAPDARSGEGQRAIEVALDAHEQIRGLLAEDRTESLAEAAGKVANPLRGDLVSLDKGAKRLGDAPMHKIEAVRRAFGEVSRSVVRLLSAEPSLTEKRYAFECPMAQGYNKWIQLSPTIVNPYMGTRMPSCGTKSVWRE